MATIVDFCRDWQVYCPPLDILFPPVYEVVQTITQQEIDAIAPGEGIKPITCELDYTLRDYHPNRIYAGTAQISQIHSILDGGDESLVIRRFIDEAAMHNYWNALWDSAVEFERIKDTGVCTAVGVFALITRPNKPRWRGPLIIYVAELPEVDHPHPAIRRHRPEWSLAVRPDQSVIFPFDDGGADEPDEDGPSDGPDDDDPPDPDPAGGEKLARQEE